MLHKKKTHNVTKICRARKAARWKGYNKNINTNKRLQPHGQVAIYLLLLKTQIGVVAPSSYASCLSIVIENMIQKLLPPTEEYKVSQ